MIVDLDDLRAALKAERKRRGVTQPDLAGLAGMTVKWLSQFENGHTDPPASSVLRLARLLGFTIVPPPVTGRVDSEQEELDLDRGVW